jgi:hypothetical protein
MADLPTQDALASALRLAAVAHEEYERVTLRGVVDDRWAVFYAAYALGSVGDFVEASRLAALLEEVDAESEAEWPAAAADHILMKLRS